MINYTAVIDILNSEHYADKTGFFERFTDFHHETLTNCSGIGTSLFLKTLACFLDKSIDTREVFLSKEISQSTVFDREINSHTVIYLDFSDFNADCYEEAKEYIRRKMSDVYKHFYNYFEGDSSHRYDYRRREEVLDIIEQHSSDTVLACSLRDLMLQFRGYETFNKERKLALLIDNLVLLETVAEAKGFSKEMKAFLKAYIVNDVYKYCDVFLQIGDVRESREMFSCFDRYISYGYFCVSASDVRMRYPEMTVKEKERYDFCFIPFVPQKHDWVSLIAEGRAWIEQEKHEEEQRRMEHARKEKERYAGALSPSVPPLSPNMGIRSKKLDRLMPRYGELNTLLKEIYQKFTPQFSYDAIYAYFQNLNEKKPIITATRRYKSEIETLTDAWQNKWCKASTNGSTSHWVQVICAQKDDPWGSPAKPENIKVYACIEDEKAEMTFIESLKHLISHAEHTFGAKIATYSRADQMCYWLSANDYKHLDSFFRSYFSEMKTPLPFVAYKGCLGISRDFPGWDDSHNATQAHIISDYMKTLNRVEQVDLEDMYNNYIAKWNADIEDEDDYGSFKRESVLSLVVILDSLDAILGKTALSEESLLLSGDKSLWHILAGSQCWSDVNERWHLA